MEASGHVWRFGQCEFDELRRELRVAGRLVNIEGKPLDVLYQLLLHPGEVLTKEELLDAGWPGLTVVDSSLSNAVAKLRKALADDSLVVTVPRVGYRLGVPVRRRAVAPPTWSELDLRPGDPVPGREQWSLARRLDASPSRAVWLAEHPKTGETRVFKFASDDLRLRSLKREVTIARLLRQSLGERRDFARILEWNFEHPPYSLEAEYVGPNLAEWAEQQGGLLQIPIERRLRLFVDIARSVADAHALGVLHKDLKPGNILVSAGQDDSPRITISDFGSAALLASERLSDMGITNLGFTQTGDASSLTGTAVYIAPEVIAGESPTALSDVFALGVLLYQLVVGDFRKPLALGWESAVTDPLLREDIAFAANGDPARRLKTAAELAERVKSLDRRRDEYERARLAQQQNEETARVRANARVRRRWLLLAGGTVLAAVAVTVVMRAYARAPRPGPHIASLAVLPFQNTTSDASLDFLRLALPDEIETTLSRVRGLTVRSTSNISNQGTLDPQKIGHELQVDAVVIGRFMRVGEQLQIALEGVDVNSNTIVWREKVEAPAQSLIATQLQVDLHVRRSLVPSLGFSEPDSGGARPQNEEAYNLFLRGVALPYDGSHAAEAIPLLERSTELDPSYPPAWHALARRYYNESRYGSGNHEMMDKWAVAVGRALALDPGYVPSAAGILRLRAERGELLEAYRRTADLVRKYPNSVDAHFALAYVLRYAGVLKESASHCETALVLDARTVTSGIRSCAIAFIQMGDYPRALNFLNVGVASGFTKALSIDLFVRQGKEAEALRVGSPGMPQWASYDMLLNCVQRRPASEIHQQARALHPVEDPEANYLFAAHLSYCGEREAAFDMLRHAVDRGYCSYPALDSDPFFNDLRTAAEFTAIRERAKACQENFLAQRH